MEEYTFAAADRGDLFDGKSHARYIVSPHDRNDGSIRTNRFLQQMEVKRAIRFNRKKADFKTALLKILAEINIG